MKRARGVGDLGRPSMFMASADTHARLAMETTPSSIKPTVVVRRKQGTEGSTRASWSPT